MYDTILIVDRYPLFKEENQHHLRLDPDHEAEGLTRAIKFLGRDNHCIVIISPDDAEGKLAYQKLGFETIQMNGNRHADLNNFIRRMNRDLNATPPKHLVVVTIDPAFALLCDNAAKNTDLSVWVPSANIPAEFNDPAYNLRELEELLPELKVAKVDLRLDYENLHIGLQKRGWDTNPRALIAALKAEIADLGEIVNIVAYADWDQLPKNGNQNIQRELVQIGIETRYLVNINGKNSADMKIADDIRTLVEKEPVDTIALVTNDRDFRPIVETVRRRGKKVVIIGLEGGLSRDLERVAVEVRYLDRRLQPLANVQPSADLYTWLEQAMRFELWLRCHAWHWAYEDRVLSEFASNADEQVRLRQAIAAKVYLREHRSRTEPDGKVAQVPVLLLNPAHPAVQGGYHLLQWAPSWIDYNRHIKGMPYVDSAYLACGMTMDATFRRLNIGQNRTDAERLLDLAVTAGVIVKRKQSHPQTPIRIITAWDVPAGYKRPAHLAGNQPAQSKPLEETKSLQQTEDGNHTKPIVPSRRIGIPWLPFSMPASQAV